MSYITLGNLTRFLNKLKTYIDNKYLKLTGGTVTGDVSFKRDIEANRVRLRSVAQPITLISNGDGNMAKEQDEKFYAFLDEKNYTEYVPKLDGTGATGTWAINISGKALNDSDGNKITDTYAKKSDIPTSSALDLTPYMKKTADSDLNMGTNKISFRGITVYGQDINGIPTLQINAKGTRGVFVTGPLILNGLSVATQDYVDDRIPTKVSQLSDDVGIAKISNGHLVINGSELWVE